MAKARMDDIVVILPGISGSVLQRDGEDVWAISGRGIWNAIKTMGGSIESLRIEYDDPELDDLADGVVADRLMGVPHSIPGLAKIDGYTKIADLIRDEFDVEGDGDIRDPEPANFFEFPYDWRRDNRVSARKLKNLIDERLPQWRDHSGVDDARIILLVHSMGGLISRYYLEVLEGWRDCRALVTFGTPHRGSVDSTNSVVNGFKKPMLDLTDMLRSFNSVYQLMPIYPSVEIGGEWHRVAETQLPCVNQERAKDALRFHREIEEAVAEHENDAEYLKDGYQLWPIVGHRQPTLQSSAFDGTTLTVSRDLPSYIDDPTLADGDGTVPRLSAIPIEKSDDIVAFIPERHSSLQNNAIKLDELYEQLKQTQVKGLGAIRGPGDGRDLSGEPAIALDLDDIYFRDEPVAIRAQVVNAADGGSGLVARVEAADGGPMQEFPFAEGSDGWEVELEGLADGLYRVEVGAPTNAPGDPHPVHDLFEVAPE